MFRATESYQPENIDSNVFDLYYKYANDDVLAQLVLKYFDYFKGMYMAYPRCFNIPKIVDHIIDSGAFHLFNDTEQCQKCVRYMVEQGKTLEIYILSNALYDADQVRLNLFLKFLIDHKAEIPHAVFAFKLDHTHETFAENISFINQLGMKDIIVNLHK